MEFMESNWAEIVYVLTTVLAWFLPSPAQRIKRMLGGAPPAPPAKGKKS